MMNLSSSTRACVTAKEADHQSIEEMRKATDEAKKRLANTDLTKLSPAELSRHYSMVIRVATKALMLSEDRKPLVIPELTKSPPRILSSAALSATEECPATLT